MLFRSLTDIEAVIRASWSRETCDPVDHDAWSPANPSRGQCAVTALVVQDLCGGELLLAEVHHPDGSRQGVHYWNRLGGGVELDLTREQFAAGEIVQGPEPVERPADLSTGRLYPQYQALSRAVRAGLGGEILHITTRAEWEAARASGRYAPPSLAAEGFIHFSDAAQVGRGGGAVPAPLRPARRRGRRAGRAVRSGAMAELDALTAADFAPHLHTPFRVGDAFDVELAEVTDSEGGAGRRQFSLLFRGGPTPPLPQRIYAVEHAQLGRLDLFLVPLGPDQAGQRYEAVFT